MPTWKSPVTDRTAQDAANRTPKGVLNAADLNRMEENTLWLADMLALGGVDASPTWQPGDLVFEKDIRRLLAGARAVREASLAAHPPALPGWMPETPAALAGWAQVNDVEAIQLRARRARDGNQTDTPHTGEAVLGARTGVV